MAEGLDVEGVGDADDQAVRMLAADAASAALGIQVHEVRRGYARLSMTVRADMLNGHDICHGGYVFLLADTAFAASCNSGRPPTVAQTAEVDFLATGHEGDVLVAEGREVHAWGRSAMYDVTVTRGDDVVAIFRGRSRTLRER